MKRLVLALLIASSTAFAQDAVTASRLKSDLEQGARLFRRNPEPGAAAAYARRLAYVEVEWQGETVAVRDPWLTDAVDSLESLPESERRKRLDAIADHLAARARLIDTSDTAPTPTETAAETPERVLEGILEGQQYRAPVEDPKLARAAARLRDRVRSAWSSVKDFIRNLFRFGGSDDGIIGIVRQLLTLLLAVTVVGAITWFVVRALVRAAADSAEAAVDEDAMPLAPPEPEKRAREADRLAESGDFRGAVRAHYLSLLGRLHREGVIVYDRHRTNREYMRSMRAPPPRIAAFADAVDVFDRKWYGKEACTREEVAAFADACRRASLPIEEAA